MGTYHEALNAEREARGVAVLDRYTAEHDRGEEPEAALSDLLADLMHAGRGRYNFETALDRARGHFYAELREATTEGVWTA